MTVEAAHELLFEICLVPNPENVSELTKLNLEDIINNSHISVQKQGSGLFSIPTTVSRYFLVINAYTAYHGPLNVKI